MKLKNALYYPRVWGRAYWRYLHISAMCYDAKKKTHKKYFKHYITKTLPTVIPCSICRRHFVAFTKSKPAQKQYGKAKGPSHLSLALRSKRNMMLFFYYAHRNANSAKSSSRMSISTFKNRYGL